MSHEHLQPHAARQMRASSLSGKSTFPKYLTTGSYESVHSHELQEVQHCKKGPATMDEFVTVRKDHEPTRALETSSTTKLRLWLFATFLAMAIAALVTLRVIDSKDAGFQVTESTTTSYAWKFGPTAIFVIVIALWRQLEHDFKVRAAWTEMTKNRAPARVSVLLDYLSPTQPQVLWQALKNRHWKVALCILVFAFLKVTVISSTGLLILRLTRISSPSVDISLAPGGQRADLYDLSSTNNAADQVALSYVSARQRGLAWPQSTLPDAAFQDLATSENSFPANSSVSATVQAFYPSLSCQEVQTDTYFTVKMAVVDPSRTIDLSVDFSYLNQNQTILFETTACSPSDETCEPQRLVPYFDALESSMGAADSDYFVLHIMLVESEIVPDNMPLNSSNPENLEQKILQGTGWTQSVAWSSTSVCEVKYKLSSATLQAQNGDKNTWRNKTLSPSREVSDMKLPDYSTLNLTSDVLRIVDSAAPYVAEMAKNPTFYQDDNSEGIPCFQAMLFEISGSDASAFRDSRVMGDAANKVFQGIASTWVGTWFDDPNNIVTEGTYEYEGHRLRTSELSFWLMVSCLFLALLCVLSLALMYIRVKMTKSQDCLIKDAKTLKLSPDFQGLLSLLGRMSDAELIQRTSNSLYVNNGGNVEVTRIVEEGPEGRHDTSRPPSFWAPASTKFWFMLITAVVTILVIVGLELVQRASDNDAAGLILSVDSSVGQNVMSIIPALVMITIAMLFNSMEWSILAANGYLQIEKSPRTLDHLSLNLLQQLPPVAIWQNLRLKNFVTSIMISAALLGSTLTIVVSALYSIGPSPTAHEVDLQTVDQFDFDLDISNASLGAKAFTFIYRSNESFPDGTYEEIAWPLFEPDMAESILKDLLEKNESTILEATMPVIRASLNCSVVPQNELVLVADKIGTDGLVNLNYPEWANVTNVSELSGDCRMTGAYDNATRYRVDSAMSGSVEEGKESRIAEIGTPKGILKDQPWESTVTWDNYYDQYPPGCPSVAFTVGTYTLNQTDTSTTTRLVCSQYFESIPSTLKFTFPGLKLDTSSAPSLRLEEAQIVSEVAWNFTKIFTYTAESDSSEDSDIGFYLDDFFQAVTAGPNSTSFADLVGPANQHTLIDAVQHVYRVYMAQVIGNDMRTRSTSKSKRDGSIPLGTKLTATVQNTTRMRIIQNRVAKIVLQAILATMCTCLLIAWRKLRTAGKTLPHNPCSIAGRMSYIAGSRFVNDIDPYLSDEELRSKYRAENVRLKLGWWDVPDNDALATLTEDSKSHVPLPVKKGAYVAARTQDLDVPIDYGDGHQVKMPRFGIDIVEAKQILRMGADRSLQVA